MIFIKVKWKDILAAFKKIIKVIDPFVALLVAMIVIAALWPTVGVDNGVFVPSEIAGWAVVVVFFLYGVKLSKQKFVAGVKNVKLHAVVQLATFVLFPIIVLAVMPWQNPSMMWIGVFFVAALPSTVSSSVVMVSIAKGDVPAAIFDASVSSLIGIVATPMWMSIFLNAQMGAAGLSDVVVKLILQVVVPVAVGMVLNKKLGLWAQKNNAILKWIDQSVILAIVYTSFCEGFFEGYFNQISVTDLIILAVGMVVLFGVIYGIILWVTKIAKFNREEKIVALFCGSKKSLVHGSVMSKILIKDSAVAGVMILPIMVYHALQLLIVSVIAARMAKQKNA